MKFIGFSILATLILGACDDREAEDRSSWKPHSALGVTVAVPDGWTVESSASQIAMSAPKDRRIIPTINLVRGDAAIPAGGELVEQSEGKDWHIILRYTAGSGGDEFRLVIGRWHGTGQDLTLTARDQSTDGTPSFSTAWAVWESMQPEH